MFYERIGMLFAVFPLTYIFMFKVLPFGSDQYLYYSFSSLWFYNFVFLALSTAIYAVLDHQLLLWNVNRYRNTQTDQNKKHTALITGGSGGIGTEFSKLFVRDSYNVFIVSFDPKEQIQSVVDELKKLNPSVQVHSMRLDLTEDGALDKLVSHLQSLETSNDLPFPSILINNAGFGSVSSFISDNVDTLCNMIDLNNKALTKLSHKMLNEWKKMGRLSLAFDSSNQNMILNVASCASNYPSCYFAVYAATKTYVRNFTLALRGEIDHMGLPVHVTCLCPSPVNNNFFKRAGNDKTNLMKLPAQIALGTSHHNASCGYYALQKNEYIINPLIFYRMTYFVGGVMPFRWTNLINRTVHYAEKKPSTPKESSQTNGKEKKNQ